MKSSKPKTNSDLCIRGICRLAALSSVYSSLQKRRRVTRWEKDKVKLNSHAVNTTFGAVGANLRLVVSRSFLEFPKITSDSKAKLVSTSSKL